MGRYNTVMDNTPKLLREARKRYCLCNSLTILSPPLDSNVRLMPHKRPGLSIQYTIAPPSRRSQ